MLSILSGFVLFVFFVVKPLADLIRKALVSAPQRDRLDLDARIAG